LSPLGQIIKWINVVDLGGQTYIRCEMGCEPDEVQLGELGKLVATSAFFWYYKFLDQHVGPFLQPIEIQFAPYFPPDLVTTRRYKGKTNELFTYFLLNPAKFSGDFAGIPWPTLRAFDPLAGGGTTLFYRANVGR
jgi:hypothetical protein